MYYPAITILYMPDFMLSIKLCNKPSSSRDIRLSTFNSGSAIFVYVCGCIIVMTSAFHAHMRSEECNGITGGNTEAVGWRKNETFSNNGSTCKMSFITAAIFYIWMWNL